MRILYNIAFMVFAVFSLPYLIARKKMHGSFGERLGALPAAVVSAKGAVWIHAVSVGEAVLAVKLASKIKKEFPGEKVIVSTTTVTGNEIARSRGKVAIDALFYSPLDLSWIVRKVARSLSPKAYIMIETELWPNLLEELHSQGVPVALVNGRISDRSFRNYGKIASVMRRILGTLSLFCMQSERDAEKIKNLGAPAKNVRVTGNIKFDEVPLSAENTLYTRAGLGFGETDNVIVCGSTHHGEEEVLLDAFIGLKNRFRNLKLIVAPRHVERAEAVGVYIANRGLKYRRFSDVIADKDRGLSSDVILVDVIGHLKYIYAAATLIFIGGSLVKKGGQNPLEGASLGRPVVFGPYMSNFREISEILIEGSAAVKVKSCEELAGVFEELLANDRKREDIGRNAERIVKENAGALERTVREIGPLMRKYQTG